MEIYIRGEFCLPLLTFKAASCRRVSFSEHLEQANGQAEGEGGGLRQVIDLLATDKSR